MGWGGGVGVGVWGQWVVLGWGQGKETEGRHEASENGPREGGATPPSTPNAMLRKGRQRPERNQCGCRLIEGV